MTVCDVVPLENAAGTVACDLHDHGLGNVGAPEIPHGCPPKIVEQQPGDAGGLASQISAWDPRLRRVQSG
jgi:hypothetical protein